MQQHYYWPVPFDLSLLGDIHLFFLVVNQDRAMRSAYYLGCLIQIEQPGEKAWMVTCDNDQIGVQIAGQR